MNQEDLNALTTAWHSDTTWLNDKIDESMKNAQDHAYQLGLARGRLDQSFKITDEEILNVASDFGEFQYGDAQGHKRIAFARAILAKVTA